MIITFDLVLHSIACTWEQCLGRRLSGFALASYPVPRPAFRRLQYGKAGAYCKRQKAGHGTGNEARFAQHQVL